MLSTVEWGEYKIGNLFTSANGNFDIQKTHINGRGNYVITAGLTDNGVLGKTDIAAKVFSAGTITIDMFGNAFFRQFDYKLVTHARVFSLKSICPISNKQGLFISNSLRYLSREFGYENMCSFEKIKQRSIFLPVKNGKIDFDFMERFVAELEAQRVAELEAYLTATGLKDYELTAAEQKALDDFENNSGSNWQEFKLIDIFKVKNTQCILSRDVEAKENGTPYLCASADNNAISSYISYNEKYLDKGNCIFIGGKTFVVTYQKNDFYSNDSHNLALYLKDSKNATLITQLFCISCIKCGLGYKYSWGDSISFKKIQNDIIQLPVKKGKIDFEFMAIFISAIQKQTIKDVVQYSDRKIAATKQCCKQASTSAK